jgi:hypothetical protein
MSTLHVTLNGTQPDVIYAAKGIRAALKVLGEADHSLSRASALVEQASVRGIVLLGTHANQEVAARAGEAADRESGGVLTPHVNITPGEAAKYTKTPDAPPPRLRPVAPAPTPIRREPSAAATMAVMMAVCNGNPLIAAAHCNNLARTAQAPVFHEARDLIIEAFPWIKDKLEAGEIA